MFSNFTDGLGSLFSVKSPVTASTDVLSPDFLKTEDALTTMGHMDGTTPDIGEGLKNFQADRGLKVDGVMNPGGPTESALKKSLASHKSSTFPSHVTVEQNGEHGATASAAFAPKPTPKVPEKIKRPSPIRVDPITGLQDPLAQPSFGPKKSNAEMAKVWDQHHQLQEARTTEDALQVLLGDELYQIKDPAYLNHVTKQFDRTFPGVAEHDETGKMVQPRPAIKPHEVEAYDPQGYLKQKKDVNSSVRSKDGGMGRSGLPNPHAVANAKEDLASQMQLDPAALEEMEAYEVADDLLGEGYQVADASGLTTDKAETALEAGESRREKETVKQLGERLLKEYGNGDQQKVLNEMRDLLAKDREKFEQLPDQIKDAYEKYNTRERSSEIHHLRDPQNHKKALALANSAAAQHHTLEDAHKNMLKVGGKAMRGFGRLYGGSDATIREMAARDQEKIDQISMPKHFENQTPAIYIEDVAGMTPFLGDVLLANEYGELAKKAGLGDGASQAAAITGLFTGRLSKVVSKLAPKQIDQVVEMMTGKKLSEQPPFVVNKVRESAAKQGVDKSVRAILEGLTPEEK